MHKKFILLLVLGFATFAALYAERTDMSSYRESISEFTDEIVSDDNETKTAEEYVSGNKGTDEIEDKILTLLSERNIQLETPLTFLSKENEQKLFGDWEVIGFVGQSLKYDITGGHLEEAYLRVSKTLYEELRANHGKSYINRYSSLTFISYEETLSEMAEDKLLYYSGIEGVNPETTGTVVLLFGVDEEELGKWKLLQTKFILLEDYTIAMYTDIFYLMKRLEDDTTLDNVRFEIQKDSIIEQLSERNIQIEAPLTSLSKENEQKLFGNWKVIYGEIGRSLKYDITGGHLEEGYLSISQLAYVELMALFREPIINRYSKLTFLSYEETLAEMAEDELLYYSGIEGLAPETTGTVVLLSGIDERFSDDWGFLQTKFILLEDYTIAVRTDSFYLLERISDEITIEELRIEAIEKDIIDWMSEQDIRFDTPFKSLSKENEQKLFGNWKIAGSAGYSLNNDSTDTEGELDGGCLNISKMLYEETRSVYNEASSNSYSSLTFISYEETLDEMSKDPLLYYSGIEGLDPKTQGTVVLIFGNPGDRSKAWGLLPTAWGLLPTEFILLEDYVIAMQGNSFYTLERNTE